MGSSLSRIQAIIYDRDFPRFPRPDHCASPLNIGSDPKFVSQTLVPPKSETHRVRLDPIWNFSGHAELMIELMPPSYSQ